MTRPPDTPSRALHCLRSVDWGAPWFAPYDALGTACAADVADGSAVHEALNAQARRLRGHLPVRFIDHARLAPGAAYESFVRARAQVPTRGNAHDFFNGLIWLHHPLAKQRLNALQAEVIACDGVRATRGAVRDAATVLDENGALLAAPEPLWQALRARDWPRLFIALRPLWRQARLQVFGHALLEKLISPRKSLVTHVYQARTAIKDNETIDAWMARDLTAAHLASKPFAPLPLLGVPGWWRENENFRFYDDSTVFRARDCS